MVTTTFTLISVIGLSLTLVIMILTWLFKKNDSKKKIKEDLKNEWKDAIKNNDAGSMLRIFNKLRKK